MLPHANATKHAVCQLLGTLSANCGSIVHFACHYTQLARWNSGLELSGSDRFTVADAIATPFKGCRLCVASACATAHNDSVADIASESIGLPSALVVSGVPCVVASLWPVGDDATQLFMKRFHLELLAGKTVARALSLARTFLREMASPQTRWARSRLSLCVATLVGIVYNYRFRE